MSDQQKKKRGRKPKNLFLHVESKKPIIEDIKSEEENIILHLPITINDINNGGTNSYFIKQEKKKSVKSTKKQISEDSPQLSTHHDNINYINVNKILIHSITITPTTKCWWCHYSFSTPAIQLPDDYYNNTFYCNGHYCSFNCAKSYNLNINDNLTWRRCSLLNLLYYQTYGKYVEIVPAPSWLILEDYGGNVCIKKFRDNFIHNTKEYTVLHPPLISRQMQIEESYKVNISQNVPINNLNKLYMSSEPELQLKRAKPISHTHLNLENTMGLIKLTGGKK